MARHESWKTVVWICVLFLALTVGAAVGAMVLFGHRTGGSEASH